MTNHSYRAYRTYVYLPGKGEVRSVRNLPDISGYPDNLDILAIQDQPGNPDDWEELDIWDDWSIEHQTNFEDMTDSWD